MSAPIADGGAAFPTNEMLDNNGVVITYFKENGMTLRDYFAAACLTGYASVTEERSFPLKVSVNPSKKQIDDWRKMLYRNDAEYCYAMADAMIEARMRKAVK
jgi:hypothetical protein